MEGATAAGGGGGGAWGGGGSAQHDTTANNMVVAVRIRPLSPRELANGATKCCKVIKGKVRLSPPLCTCLVWLGFAGLNSADRIQPSNDNCSRHPPSPP